MKRFWMVGISYRDYGHRRVGRRHPARAPQEGLRSGTGEHDRSGNRRCNADCKAQEGIRPNSVFKAVALLRLFLFVRQLNTFRITPPYNHSNTREWS